MTKERLRAYAALKREKEHLQGLLVETETRLYTIGAQQLTGMPSAHNPDGGSAQERLATATEELRARYRAKLEEISAEQLEIERAIDTLPPVQRELIRRKYVDGMTWEEIADAMNYSWRHVHRLHGSALLSLRDR